MNYPMCHRECLSKNQWYYQYVSLDISVLIEAREKRSFEEKLFGGLAQFHCMNGCIYENATI